MKKHLLAAVALLLSAGAAQAETVELYRGTLLTALAEAEGFVKTVFDETTGELLGAHMVGAEVTELIQGYVVTRQLETTEADLMHTIFPHPTLSEMMHESVLDAYGRAVHY